MDYSADTDANRDDNVDIFEGLVFFIGREVRMAMMKFKGRRRYDGHGH